LAVQALRSVFGDDELFYKSMKAYRADHVAKEATPDSMRESLEKASGLDLSVFFSRWIYAAGYPTFELDLKQSKLDSGYSVQVTAAAQQDFGLPLEVELLFADGSTRRERLNWEKGKAQIKYEGIVASEIVALRADPDRNALARVVGVLDGDVDYNGEVDGIDLIQLAAASGSKFEYLNDGFDDRLDLVFDGIIDSSDVSLAMENFGKGSGE